MKDREPAINGDEHDWTTCWRHALKVFDKPGLGKKVKRKMNKRSRRKIKQTLRNYEKDN